MCANQHIGMGLVTTHNCVFYMSFFWFDSIYWQEVKLDCYGGQYSELWNDDDTEVIGSMKVLSGPQELDHYVYSDDEVPF